MLSPAFRSLDPDAQQIERLASCASPTSSDSSWPAILSGLAPETRQAMALRVRETLSQPGIHDQRQVNDALRAAAGANGVSLPEPVYFGWPQSQWEHILRHFTDPKVLLLGILDGDGIWAGCLAGVEKQRLDFIATFQWLWADDPELASRQDITDLEALCQAASSRFGRTTAGLFIYRNEFMSWRDATWSSNVLREFLEKRTASLCGFSLSA